MSKNLSQQVVLDRRGFVAATFATVAGLGLAGCSDTSAEADKGSAAGSSKGSEDTERVNGVYVHYESDPAIAKRVLEELEKQR